MKEYLIAALLGGVVGASAVAPIGSIQAGDCPVGMGCPSRATLLVGIQVASPYPDWLPIVAALVGGLLAVSGLCLFRLVRSGAG